jgi:hypothetical protein
MLRPIYSVQFSSQLRLNFELFKFLNTLFQNKINFVLLWLLLPSTYALGKSGAFPPSMPAMSQDLVLHHSMLQLQTASAELWTFLINILHF